MKHGPIALIDDAVPVIEEAEVAGSIGRPTVAASPCADCHLQPS